MKLMTNTVLLAALAFSGFLARSANAQSEMAVSPEGTCICKLESQYHSDTRTNTYRWSLQYAYFADSARLIILEAVDEYSFDRSIDANEACRKVAAQYSVCK